MWDNMAEKVKDEAKEVKNAHLRKVLADQSIDADYVELVQGYAPRRVNGEVMKGRSPYARFYKDRKSNKRVMEVGILPHCDTLGRKIDCRWIPSGNKYYSGINLFSAIVDGDQIKVTALSDQPHGAKKNDWVSWAPQLFLDGIEQLHTEPTLLTTDPINAGYHDNTIEWDYGICKRRIRIIEGRIREKWVFDSNPNGEVRIKHNHTGNYGLRLLTCKISDDEELVPSSVFDGAEYPFEVMASPETFYPDPDAENTSVDGFVRQGYYDVGSGVSWATIRGEAGQSSDDSSAIMVLFQTVADSVDGQWRLLDRCIVLFDTSGLPNDATVTGATLSIYGSSKGDTLSITPNVNVYKSTPFANTALQADDFVDIGTIALCATPITYAGWDTAGYNDFALTDVDTDDFGYISLTGITKLGARNANYDVSGDAPVWGENLLSGIIGESADQGNTTNDPKLVVTYTTPTNYNINSAVSVGVVVTASRVRNRTIASAVYVGIVASASRSLAISRASSVIVGIVASASRSRNTTRASSVIVGVVATAARTRAYIRTASVITGILVTAKGWPGFIRFTLRPRVLTFALKAREFAYTLKSRVFTFTLKEGK